MKNIKSIIFLGCVLLMGLTIYAMRITTEGQKNVWVRVATGQLIEIPKIYMNRMRTLHDLLVAQPAHNSQNYPLLVPHLSDQELMLMCDALKAIDDKNFDDFYTRLQEGDSKLLLKVANVVGAGDILELALRTMQIRLSNKVWMRTADNKLMAFDKWEIEQMKLLHLLFLQQKGTNSEKNPIALDNANLVGAVKVLQEDLLVLDIALQKSKNFEEFQAWFFGLDKSQQQFLVNAAGKVEAMGIVALCGSYYLPAEAQVMIDTTLLQPVIDYLHFKTMEEMPLSMQLEIVSCVAFNLNGDYVVFSIRPEEYNDHSGLIIWDIERDQQKKVLSVDQRALTCISVSPKCHYIASSSAIQHKSLIIWDVETGEQKHLLSGHINNYIGCIAFSPDSKYLVSGSNGQQNNLILWDVKTGQQKYILNGHQGNVTCVAFSPDSKYVVSGSNGQQNNLILWNVETGQQQYFLSGHQNDVACVAFSPDGKYIISGSYGYADKQNNLIMWDVETGQQKYILKGYQNDVSCVAFSSDGKYIVSGATGYELVIWNAKTGKRAYILNKNPARIDPYSCSCVVFSRHDKSIVYNIQNKVIVWKSPYEETLNYIEKYSDMSQARFLHRLYFATLHDKWVTLHDNDPDYAVYKTLREDIQDLINQVFRLTLPENKNNKNEKK